MSFFAKKSTTSTELIFDIESDSVCVSIVIYEPNKVPRIVYNASSEIIRKAHTDGAYLTRNMLKTLDATAHATSAVVPDLLKKKVIEKARFDNIHFVLSSPWIISKLSSIEKTFEKEVVIKHAIIAPLIQKEKDETSRLFAAGDSLAIDTKLFEIKLNGYHVVEYENKRASSIEGTFVVSFASRKLVNDMKLAVNRFFRTTSESFHSAVFLRYVALRSLMPLHTDYLWLQIHGELTDICLIYNGVCVMNGSLPFGSYTLLHKFANVTKENETTAASTLALFQSGGNTGQMAEKTRLTIGKILSEWTCGIADLISGGKESALSGTAYVSAEHFSFAFEEAAKKLSPSISVRHADVVIMAPFVQYDPSVSADLSASLYAATLPMAQKM
jgi:hypothetical protein